MNWIEFPSDDVIAVKQVCGDRVFSVEETNNENPQNSIDQQMREEVKECITWVLEKMGNPRLTVGFTPNIVSFRKFREEPIPGFVLLLMDHQAVRFTEGFTKEVISTHAKQDPQSYGSMVNELGIMNEQEMSRILRQQKSYLNDSKITSQRSTLYHEHRGIGSVNLRYVRYSGVPFLGIYDLQLQSYGGFQFKTFTYPMMLSPRLNIITTPFALSDIQSFRYETSINPESKPYKLANILIKMSVYGALSKHLYDNMIEFQPIEFGTMIDELTKISVEDFMNALINNQKNLYSKKLRELEQKLNNIELHQERLISVYSRMSKQQAIASQMLDSMRNMKVEFGFQEKFDAASEKYELEIFDENSVAFVSDEVNLGGMSFGKFKIVFNFESRSIRVLQHSGNICSPYIHPHLNSNNAPCLGNMGEAVLKMFAEYDLPALCDLMSIYVKSYSAENPFHQLSYYAITLGLPQEQINKLPTHVVNGIEILGPQGRINNIDFASIDTFKKAVDESLIDAIHLEDQYENFDL